MATPVSDVSTSAIEQPGTPVRRRASRWISQHRYEATAVLIVALAVGAVYANAPGWYVADARLEHSIDPIQFLRRHATIWDNQRNPGEPAPYFSPVIAAFQAGWQVLGAAPWVIERHTHALYLIVAGVGTLVLARRLAPARYPAHLVAALLYAFNPYTTQFLTPSGLFVSYALAPWLAWFGLRGIEGRDPWRWAAWFAMAIFSVGLLNTASLIYSTLPTLVLCVGSVVHAKTASWRSVASWVWRTLVLTVTVSAAGLMVLSLIVTEIRTNLATTELPETVARTSSAGESWRGLGLWLTYFRSGGVALRPQSANYLDQPLVVAATYVAPVFAAVGLWLGRFRYRATLAMLVAITIVLMVGIHPPGSAPPIGDALRYGFEQVELLRSFRSTYKAGAGLQLAIAVLAGVGFHELLRQRRRSRPNRLRHAAAVLTLCLTSLLLVVAAHPYVTGSLYSTDDRFEAVPDYWQDTFAWFDGEPRGGRVLVLPGVTRARYRWGYVNDNLFDSYLSKPIVMHQSLPQGTAQVADAVAAIDEFLTSGDDPTGATAPMLRRLGIRWVIIQNDLDWQTMGVSRPATFDRLRADPALRRVATFGGPGENTVDPDDALSRSSPEGALPPVEIFEVDGSQAPVRLTTAPPVLLSGGADAWPALARRGWLGLPTRLIGELSPDEVRRAVDAGSPIVVTDGARRRAIRVTTSRNRPSHTLSATEDVGRAPQGVFTDSAHQTIATFGEIRSVTATRYGAFDGAWTTWWRPANAFDDDPTTAWAISGGDSGIGVTLRAELVQATDLRSIRLRPFAEQPTRRVLTSVEARFVTADGSMVDRAVDLTSGAVDGWVSAPLDADAVVAVEIEITGELSLGQQAAGLAEVDLVGPFGPVDGREFLRVPTDLADLDAVASESVIGAPVSYVFSRWRGVGGDPEETEIRRLFDSIAPETLDGSVRLAASADTSDQALDALLGGPVGAFGSARFADDLTFSGANVLDGNPNTAWEVEPTGRDRITIRLPNRRVDRLQIDTVIVPSDRRAYSRVRTFTVRIDGADGPESATFDTTTRIDCEVLVATPEGDGCIERWDIPISATRAETIAVDLTRIDVVLGLVRSRPVRIAEIRPYFADVDVSTLGSRRGDVGCRSLMTLDGAPVDLFVAQDLTLARLRQGIDLVTCTPIELASGSHVLETDASLRAIVQTIDLTPRDFALTFPPPPGIAVVDSVSAVETRVTARGGPGQFMLTDIPVHPGWVIEVDGEPRNAVTLDGSLAVAIDEPGPVEVVVRFGPQRSYEMAWLVTAAGLALCVWLVLPVRRRHA